MNLRKGTLILAGIVILAVLAAGCTSGNPSTATPTTTTVTLAAGGPVTTSAPAVQITPECPDKYGKGVWDYAWDTRWLGYAGNHDIRDIANGKAGEPDSWNGINAPQATDVTMTQVCRNVTGTIAFSKDPVCTGTFTATIEKNQLTGVWTTTGCQPEDAGSDGIFSVIMADDNMTWTGKLISNNDPYKNHDEFPPDWAGRRI